MHLYRLYLFLLITYGLAACAPAPTPLPTAALATATSTSIPPSATPTVKPTPIPTLLRDEKIAYWLDLMDTNAGCKLPCILGIIPGLSIWEDLRAVEAPSSYRENYAPNEHGALLMGFPNVNLLFIGSDTIIEKTVVNAYIYQEDSPRHSSDLTRVMEKYSLDNALAEYGEPDRVRLRVESFADPPGGWEAEILLFYDAIGAAFHYVFIDVVNVDAEAQIIETCPRHQNIELIRIYLQQPANKEPLERLIGDYNSLLLTEWLKPLAQVTDLSVHDLFNSLTDPETGLCFSMQR